jgi:hypothetical protein
MQVIDEGVVFAGRAKTDAASACFPSVCVLPGGRWIAGMRLGPAKSSRSQRTFVTRSDDRGKTWSGPVEVAGPASVGGRPGTWRAVAMAPLGGADVLATLCWEDHTDPLVPMFNEQTEGLVDMKLFIATSNDGGNSFSQPRRVHTGQYDDVPTPITGSPLVLPNGTWAVPFEVNKHYRDERPWQHVSALAFTPDRGRTWSADAAEVHTDPDRRIFCWDQRLSVLPDGSILGMFWTFDRGTDQYLNVHARRSTDGGRSWGELWDTGVAGQPARVVALGDGRLLMTYVDRTGAPAIKCRTSRDGGRTWPAESELLVHTRQRVRSQTWDKRSMQDAWAEMSAFSLGIPDAVALAPATAGGGGGGAGNEALLVFYSGDHPDLTDIRWARVRADCPPRTAGLGSRAAQ